MEEQKKRYFYKPQKTSPNATVQPAAPGSSQWALDYRQFDDPLRDGVAFIACSKDGLHREVMRETLTYALQAQRMSRNVPESTTDLEFLTPPFPASAMGPNLDHWELQACEIPKRGQK